MFHWRDEGELIRQGFNVYPLASRWHVGGILRIGRLQLYLRWSKARRRFYHSVDWLPA